MYRGVLRCRCGEKKIRHKQLRVNYVDAERDSKVLEERRNARRLEAAYRRDAQRRLLR